MRTGLPFKIYFPASKAKTKSLLPLWETWKDALFFKKEKLMVKRGDRERPGN
jgi:hypothetical protein